MSMQNDVRSTYLTAAGTVFAGPARVRGFICSGAPSVAATFEIRDGSATGTVMFKYSIPSNPNINSINALFPDDGIRCPNGAYLTISVGSVTCISVFYA